MTPVNPIARHREHCREVRAQLSDYLDSEVDERAGKRIERHARWCPNCRRMIANMRRTVGGLHALAPESDAASA